MTAQLSLFTANERADTWSVRTSRRAKRLSVRVYPGGRVEIVAPPGASPIVVQRFIGQHRQWIADRVQAFAGMVCSDTTLPTLISLPAIDTDISVKYIERDCKVRIESTSSLDMTVIGRLGERHTIALALRRHMTGLAMTTLGAALRQVADQTALQFQRVQIRRQRTRWGSCSANGTISLNVCLLFQERDVSRYLMIHELCHTKHMNHSARFWALVGHHEPAYKILDRALLAGWQRVPWWMFG